MTTRSHNLWRHSGVAIGLVQEGPVGRRGGSGLHLSTEVVDPSSRYALGVEDAPRDTSNRIRLLLVDDHTVVRQGLRMVLTLEPDLEVVGEAADGREALKRVAELRPDVVLMDLLMPVMTGVEAIRAIKRDTPEVEVVALTSVLEDRLVVDAVEAGATGYLLKDTGPDVLVTAIRAAYRGEVHLDPKAKKRLVREVRTPEMRESLTARETEILRLVARGFANKQIAEQLEVSEVTVKTHVSSILSKLSLQSRTQAALFALKEGLVGLD